MAGVHRGPDHGAGCSQLSSSGKRKKPPIDNDYEHLDDDDDDDCKGLLKESEQKEILDGQVRATITQYGDIKVMPFNLKEELEEGEFDKAGNFIFKKKNDSDEEENDTWAESVNWAEVEEKERQQREQAQHDLDAQMNIEPTEESEIRVDKISAYKSMLRLMKPDETVKKTIQRLGNNIPKRKPFNKNAKSKMSQGTSQDAQTSDTAEARRVLDLMIDLAYGRLEDGDTDIYQKTYEDLEDAIN